MKFAWLPLYVSILFAVISAQGNNEAPISAEAVAKSIEILPHSEEHRMIERLYSKFLATYSGASLCLIAELDVTTMQRLFGLSEEVAQKSAQECRSLLDQMLTPQEIIQARLFDSARLNNIKKRPAKKYYIVPSTENFPYESWTDLQNRTWIAEDVFYSEKLAFALIHEAQVAFDGKVDFDLSITDGWTVLNTREQVLQDFMFHLKIIHDGPLMNIFRVMRALNFEISVFGDLVGKPVVSQEKTFVPEENECNEKVDFFLKEYLQGQSQELRNYVLPGWEQIKATPLRFVSSRADKRKVNFCQFMTIPSFRGDGPLTSGPRPRIRPSTAREIELVRQNMSDKELEELKRNLKNIDSNIIQRPEILKKNWYMQKLDSPVLSIPSGAK